MSVRPIFLFSVPRSGSTLLQRMLACNSKISTHSELWFLLPHIDAIKNQYGKSIYSMNSLGRATQSLCKQLPDGEDGYFQGLRQLSDHIYTELAGPKAVYILDKTPRYYFIIPEIYRLYPDAKFIFLFRNPLSVAASLVESFFRGRLGDYRHRVDMFEGPGYLARGYEQIRSHSFSLCYENLVHEPDVWLKQICEYLEIPFEPSMSTGFKDVPVGDMGDQFGSRQYSGLATDSVEKWRTVFSTGYRRRYLKKYLRYLGKDTVECMGYDYSALDRDIDNLPIRFDLSIEDRVRELICLMYSAFELPLLREKLAQRKQGRRKMYMHH